MNTPIVKPTKVGQTVVFHTPFEDECKFQQYLIKEITEESILMVAIHTTLSIPPSQRVSINDVTVVDETIMRKVGTTFINVGYGMSKGLYNICVEGTDAVSLWFDVYTMNDYLKMSDEEFLDETRVYLEISEINN